MKTSLAIALPIVFLPFAVFALTPTLTFENPQPLTADGVPIDLGSHAAPRLVDWNDDQVVDLLVADGVGYIWLFLQDHPTNFTDYLPGVRVDAAGSPIRVGTGYTGVCFADIDGDGKNDLIAAGDDRRVRIYSNTGTRAVPVFSAYSVVPGSSGEFVIPSFVSGRIEIADWDGDGKLDLLTGEFDGYVTWYRNTGTTTSPVFSSPGIAFAIRNATIHEPYNTHPRVVDLNQDGLPDLAFGVNWGYVRVLMNSEGYGATNFTTDYLLRDPTGAALNFRALNDDDTIPDFADLTGDGVLDLISGGLNGKLFVMRGVSYSESLQGIESIMAAHPADLGAALNGSTSLRETLFGLHRSLRDLANSILPPADRQTLRDWYRDHIARYPQYLTKRQLNQTTDAYVPYLAGQVWVNLFESMPDTPTHRITTANAAGFTGKHESLLVDLGIIYTDNSRSTVASQTALYDIAASLPESLQTVDVVTENDFLKTGSGGGMAIEARRSVNVFAQVGDYSEGFPPDVPQTLMDGFSLVVAHELNHNVEVAAGMRYPWFYDRKYDLLEQAAPSHLIFKNHGSAVLGLDLPATQANFLARGYWDGVTGHWTAAYDAYWATGPGAGFDRHWLRDNLRYCIDAPQEAFATLSNQYINSSEMMLQLALSRWQEGITNCINQFLFFVDVYTLGSNQVFFYRVDTAAHVTRTIVPIQRDDLGHISGLTTMAAQYDFLLDTAGNVQNVNANLRPILSHPIADPAPLTYGSTFNFQFSANAFTDPDHDPLNYAASGMPVGIAFQGATRTFSGAPEETGVFSVTVIATDSRSPILTVTDSITLTITPAALSVVAETRSKSYGETDPELGYAVNGLQSGDTAGAVLTGTLARATGESVGGSPYAITQGTLAANGNYSLNFTGSTLTITPAALSVVAETRSKSYGETDPELGYAVNGLQSGDTAGAVLTGTLARATGESVGGSPYAITQGTLAASGNYNLNFTGSTLTIIPAALSVVADNLGKSVRRARSRVNRES